MLKRLIFAVFVMGIFFALSGTAISDIGTKSGLNPIVTEDPSAQLYGQTDDARPAQPTFKKPISEIQEVPLSGIAPTPPQNYYCEDIGYYDPAVSTVYIWTIPDAYGDDLFNTRFTVDEGTACSLKVGWILMLQDYMVGAPDMKIYLWDDDGFGFPGNVLDSVTIPYASMPTGGWYWASADFTANGNDWVFNELEEYHIGWTVANQDGTNTLCGVSDQDTGPHSGEERCSEWYGVWGSMLNDWGGDYIFLMTSERCCYELPYTDCYSQSYYEGAAYIWGAPHASYDIIDYAQRFSVNGPETLQSVDVAIYNYGAGAGTNDVIITVWDNDGAGYPGAQLAQATIPAGGYAFFPTFTTFDFSSFNLVLTDDFFVSFNSSGDFASGTYEMCLSDDETTPNGRSFAFYGGGWMAMGDLFGIDIDYLFNANLCRDPYAICSWNWNNNGIAYLWNLPDSYGDFAHAQKFKAIGEECKIDEVNVAFYDFDGGVGVTSYLSDSKISIYSDLGGYPGTELASITVTPAEYVIFPGMTTVDFLPQNVIVTDYYWVAVESMSPTVDDIATISDAGGGSMDYGMAEYWGAWGHMYTTWGLPSPEWAFVMEAHHCCIPFSERWCGDPAGSIDLGWSTFGHDAARTNASFVPVGDAQCDMSLVWDHAHPTQQALFNGPSMFDGKVIQAFNTNYRVFDFAGTMLYELTGFPYGDNIRCTPTIAVIPGFNGDAPVAFLAGGTQQSFTCVDFNTGALLWSRDIGTVGPTGLFGTTQYSTTTLLDIGGTWVVFWTTADGSVVAAEALTGTLYAGWTVNPVSFGMDIGQWGVSDGTSLFFGGVTGTNVDGDVWSVDAATGTIIWQLSAAGGLQGNTVYSNGDFAGEYFQSCGAFENDILYANTGFEDYATGPVDGVLYAINAADGSIVYASASARTLRSGLVIDANSIYVANWSGWVTPPIGGGLVAHSKTNGSVLWTYADPDGAKYYGTPILTCEPDGAPDLLYAGAHKGMLACVNSTDGDEVYRRRIDYGQPFNSMWNSGAIGPNGELAFAHFYGGLSFLSKGVDRPRLEIQSYSAAQSVEFGSALSLPVTFASIITNTGCTDLTINDITTDDICANPYTPNFASIRPEVEDDAMTIADRLTNDFTLKAPIRNETVNEVISARADRGNLVLNAGSRARPAFINTNVDSEGILAPADGYLLAPGDSLDITVDINQSLINRGPQYFCMYIDTDDPDFYLNPSFGYLQLPCIQATIVGGCLIDNTELWFGMGAANLQRVYNTGRLTNGGEGDFTIDGDDASDYQSTYVYATGLHEVALNTCDWHGGGEDVAYISMQPDPNYFDGTCIAALETGVDLGSYTTDGVTYEPITGDMVHKSFIDSVQNFDDGGGWDWTSFPAPFDNALTMGLFVNSRVAGAVDFTPLKDVTVEIFEVNERNGNAVTGWKFGSTHDYDIGGDVIDMVDDYSVAYVTAGGAGDVAWGKIKLPYGCASHADANLNVLKNTRTLCGNWAWWSDVYLDSAYIYMSNPPGATHQTGDGSDAEAHITYVEHDFEANGTMSFAVVNFALHGIVATDETNYSDLSTLCNKWVGFGRGDVNNDGLVNLADIVYLNNYVMFALNGPIPFMHLGDVDGVAGVNGGDVTYMLDWYFGAGDCPMSDWAF